MYKVYTYNLEQLLYISVASVFIECSNQNSYKK